MAVFSHALLILAAIGGAASVIALAAVLVSDEAWARWKNARRGSRAIFALAVVLAALYGGTKSAGTRVNYPRTDSGTAYLTDNGSSVTNDAVVLNFTRSSLVPDDAWLFLDACPLSVTNAADVAANCVTVYSNQFSAISLPLTVAYANATNYVWYAYTDWTPGPVVHTNGVVNVAWLKSKGEMPPSALRVVPLRTEVNPINAETPEERAFRIYAPCSAFEVTVTSGATFTVALTRLSGHASATVDWGDGTASTHTSSPASHAYAAEGKFVVKISDDVSTFSVYDYAASRPLVTAALRWGDSVTSAASTYRECSKLTGFVPRWGKNVTDANRTYIYCGSLNCEIPPWGENLAIAQGTYAFCYNLTGTIPPWGANVTDAGSTYDTCENLTGTIPPWNDKITNANWTYIRCSKLTGEIPPWTDKIVYAFRTYRTCPLLTGKIPKWGAAMKDVGYCYQESTGLTGAWTDDPAELMPTDITSHEGVVTDASAALRALFYSNWGGTRTKEE